MPIQCPPLHTPRSICMCIYRLANPTSARTTLNTDDHLHHRHLRPSRTPYRAEGTAAELLQGGPPAGPWFPGSAVGAATHTAHGGRSDPQADSKASRVWKRSRQNVLAGLLWQTPPTNAGTTVGRCQSTALTFLEEVFPWAPLDLPEEGQGGKINHVA